LKARNARFNLIKKQLILEAENTTHVVNNYEMALKNFIAKTKDIARF
jgi:hypothetical protein